MTAGCSTSKSGKPAEDLAARGPTILDVRANPGTFDTSTKGNVPPEVLADVKDFNSKVSDVRLRFVHAPLEIRMKHIGGTTWRAQLTHEQLQQLAVNGQTINYEANVIARDEKGDVTVGEKPLEIAVRSPRLSRPVS